MLRHAGINIRAARTSRRLTAGQLSQKLGISRSYLTLIETGARPLPSRLVTSLSTALHIPKTTTRLWYLDQEMSVILKTFRLSPTEKSRLLVRLNKST